MKRLALLLIAASAAQAQQPPSREKALHLAGNVHVIFEHKCNECHGSHLKKPEGKFGHVLDLKRLADNLDARTKELSAGLSRFTGSGLRQYEALATDARRTLDDMNRTLRSLEKNPQQLLFGRKPAAPEYGGR